MKYFPYVLISLAAVSNLIGFFIIWWDKQAAINKYDRISELNLFGIALIGGAAGEYAAMRLFRHKTRKKRFVYGIPAIILIQIAAILLYKLYLG